MTVFTFLANSTSSDVFVGAIKVYAAFGDNPFIFATVWVAEFKEQDRLMRAAVCYVVWKNKPN